MFIDFYNKILYQPLFNALIFLYQYLPGRDFGVAVIVLTILIRILLYPFFIQSIKSQKILSELQPKIQEIQKKYKDDKEKQTKEIITLYQKEKINPFGGCLTLLIQLPILIALYQVFWKGLQFQSMEILYSFVPHPGEINPNFLGLINLKESNLFLAIFAAILQFIQSKTTPSLKTSLDKTNQFSDILQKQMLYFFPIFTILILLKLPSAIALYWIVTILFSIFQQYLIFRKKYDARKF